MCSSSAWTIRRLLKRDVGCLDGDWMWLRLGALITLDGTHQNDTSEFQSSDCVKSVRKCVEQSI